MLLGILENEIEALERQREARLFPSPDTLRAVLARCLHSLSVDAHGLAFVVVGVVVQVGHLVYVAPGVRDPEPEEAGVGLAQDAGGTQGPLGDVELRLAPLRVHDVRVHLV